MPGVAIQVCATGTVVAAEGALYVRMVVPSTANSTRATPVESVEVDWTETFTPSLYALPLAGEATVTMGLPEAGLQAVKAARLIARISSRNRIEMER